MPISGRRSPAPDRRFMKTVQPDARMGSSSAGHGKRLELIELVTLLLSFLPRQELLQRQCRAQCDVNDARVIAETRGIMRRAATEVRCAPGRAAQTMLQRCHHRFGLADIEAARRLDREVRHLAVLRDQGIALAAPAHAAGVQVEFQP